MIFTNPQFSVNPHFISVIGIIQNKIMVMVGNDEIGQFFFPSVLEFPYESGGTACRRAGYEQCGLVGDCTSNPFYVEGNVSWYVMDINREDSVWSEVYKSRKHFSLVDVENDASISDHDKFIIGECNLQGYVIY